MTQQFQDTEKQRFLEVKTLSGNIAAGATKQIDLSSTITKYGVNFNTVTVVNSDSTCDIVLILDGKEVVTVLHSNGAIGLDWEDGINFSSLAIKNAHGSTVLDSANVKLSIGRTGVKNG